MSNSPKTIVILGATSAVAQAYARLRTEQGPVQFILVGRNTQNLAIIRDDLIARGADTSVDIAGDLGVPDNVPALFDLVKAKADRVDEVVLAYGILGDQDSLQKDMTAVRTLLDVDFVSAAMWAEAFADLFVTQGSGHLVIIGSVAGDRGRQSNYLYGAAKAGLERMAEGMAHRFAGSAAIHVTLVKPGFIDTPMTDHIPGKGGPLWATPDKIAQVMARAVDKKRVRVYAPWFWRGILLIVRSLPVPIMHKTRM